MNENSNLITIMLTTIFIFSCSSQQQVNQLKVKKVTKKPKLIVGVVIDQMRAEYLYRFQDNYTENGFKRLLREGFHVKNTHYNYIPTATGPGHASIYTGATPADHGIVSNNWYSRGLERVKYCAEDSTVFLVDNLGIYKSLKFSSFSRSPRNILTTTITDELKLFTNNRSKVIGLSIKDRSSIFSTGHLADAAYWYNSNNGNFVTSTYYKNELPKWLQKFNNQQKADSLLNIVWKPLLPIEKYKNSSADNSSFEKIYKGKLQSTFPYNLKRLRKNNGESGLLTEVPFGNTILTELVKATLQGENLGKGKEIDFLAISYSSTDYIGHNFGIRSKELEDVYVRMDREIATLLQTLDQQIGKENYTLFLTADHAGSDHPHFLSSKNLPGQFFSSKKIRLAINNHLSQKFGIDSYISYMDKTQIYIAETKQSKELIANEIAAFLKTVNGVKEVFIPESKQFNIKNSNVGTFIKNTYNSKISGDIIYHMYFGWMEERSFGTTHGTSYTSDTHVPLLWYGCNIAKGESIVPHTITQIAPTISFLLDIPLPSSSNRQPILDLFK